MQQNDEQVRRHANPTDALQQSKDAMAEAPPPPAPNHGGDLVGTLPDNAADAERIILDKEAKDAGTWPPAFLKR